MPIHNKDIADMFNKTADLLEIKGENPFRIRAYRNAARTVLSFSNNVAEWIFEDKASDLIQYPNIGKDLAGKIEQIVKTGHLKLLEDLKQDVPEELINLMKIPGLGAKRVSKLYKELAICSFDDLKDAINDNKIQNLKGFWKKNRAEYSSGNRASGKTTTAKSKA